MKNPGVAVVAAKYAELLADVRRLRLDLRTAEFSLEHVKVTLLLLDPEYPVGDIKPPRPRASPKPQSGRNRMAIDFLRESATPMTSREIARHVLSAEGNASQHRRRSILLQLEYTAVSKGTRSGPQLRSSAENR